MLCNNYHYGWKSSNPPCNYCNRLSIVSKPLPRKIIDTITRLSPEINILKNEKIMLQNKIGGVGCFIGEAAKRHKMGLSTHYS